MPAYSSEEEYSSADGLSDEELAVALADQQRGAAAAASDDDGSGEQGEGGRGAKGAPARRPAIYNVDALHDKLEDIGWVEEQAWEESMALTSSEPVALENADDDLERELAFYNQALEAAQTAIRRFEAAGIAWQRPADYYAEMVKSDEHMTKVKEQLLYEKQQIEATEARKKEREAKKFSKQVAAARKAERAQEKKAAIGDISKLRKQREKSGFAGELDVEAELERLEGGGGRGRRQQQQQRKPGERFTPRDKSAKRERRDAKFGFGGPKRLKKQNDAGSTADVDGYRPSRFDDGVARKVGGRGGGRGGRGGGGRGGGGRGGGGRGGGVKKGGKAQRPGKARRAAAKAGR